MNYRSSSDEVMGGNTIGGIIVSYMRRDLYWTSQELFRCLTDDAKRTKHQAEAEWKAANAKLPHMRLYSYGSFITTMCKLVGRKFIKAETVRGEGCPYLRYRLADGVTEEASRPKAEITMINELKLSARDTAHLG